jgi:deazaflavin-dependent oxidoreductase (nitroreductase family)
MPQVEPYTKEQERYGHFLIKTVAAVQVLLYKLSGGRIANTFRGGKVILATMTGRKTGKRRTLPLVYAMHGKRVILAASEGGMSRHPSWYHNMKANPEVEIQIGPERRMMRVVEAKVSEEKALWEKLDAAYPEFKEYRLRAKMSNRKIPILVAEPRG